LLTTSSFWGVFWVDVASEASARGGFMAIAKALKSPVETTEEILHMLASMTDRWLLILDNADDHQVDYATYFPSGNRGAIIMTSRVPECRQYSTVTPELLQTLDPKHSTQLLLKAAQVPEASWSTHTAHAEEIVDLLASHTLALIQAGAYIAGGYCSLHQYPERFLQQRKHLLEHYPHQQRSRYRNVYATFEASIDVLMHSDGEAGKDALSLLTILSMLHTSALPTQLFQDTWADARQLLYYGSSVRDVPQHTHKPQRSRRFKFNWGRSKHVNPSPELEKTYDVAQEHISRLPGFLGLELQEWNDSRLMKASALLISLSLVTHEVSNDSDGLSMHPLAHAWAKDRMGKQEQQDAWIQAACLCMLSLLTSKLWHTHKTELRPHMQALTSPQPEILFAYGPKSFMLPIMVQCGWCLLSVGEYRGLQTLLEGIYQYLGVTPWSLPKEQTHLWRLAATASVYSRRTKLAVFLFEHITKVDETSVAPRHPSRLRSRFDLARAYTDNGESERAITLLEDLIVTCRTWSNQDLLLISQIELTRAYNITGQSKKAAELLEPVVKEQNIVGCKESQHAKLRSQHGLSVAYIGNGQLKDAIALLEHVVTSYEVMLDEKHDDRIVSQYDLARAYKEDGQFEKALALIKYVVRIQETTPGQNQHSLAMSRYALGSTYIACGGYKKQAVQTMEQVVKSHGAMLDETQSELLSAQYGLALAYVDDRRPEAALLIMQHVVRVRKRTLDSTHPHRLQSERLLAELEAGTVYD
jgi:tetratricopeptide (TPR) repeat protein